MLSYKYQIKFKHKFPLFKFELSFFACRVEINNYSPFFVTINFKIFTLHVIYFLCTLLLNKLYHFPKYCKKKIQSTLNTNILKYKSL